MKKPIQQMFSVPFSYQVHFTEHIFQENNLLLAKLIAGKQKAKVLFVIDQGVVEAHPQLLDNITNYGTKHVNDFTLCSNHLVIPGGEQAKNKQKYLQQILDAVNAYGIDRHSFLIAIGGGAILDMAGFAATIAHRGVRHIRIPTTVLAQNDSGVGVKNSINAYGKKNFLGTFAPPYAVINDFTFLTTLDSRDWRSGISEAVKVALIKDAEFFNWIEENAPQLAARNIKPMEDLVYRCAEMHLEHISGGDPFESGSSRPLDFGHWAAHKLEQLTNYSIRHGEAVAIGIMLDTTYSYLQGMISEQAFNRVANLFKSLGFDLYVPELLYHDKIIKGLEEFREHLGGQLTIMLLQAIGKGVEVHEMDKEVLLHAIHKLKEFQVEISTVKVKIMK